MNDATISNTIFVSVADYKDAEHRTRHLRMTAEKYGVPIQWASWGHKWEGFISKYIKMLAFLQQTSSSIKYVYFLDARDCVFVKPVDVILQELNEVFLDGILFNVNRSPLHADFMIPAIYEHLCMASLAGKFGNLNSGLYVGKKETLMRYYRRVLELREEIMSGGWQRNEMLKRIVESERYQDVIKTRTLYNDDEFMALVVMTCGFDRAIRGDVGKQHLSTFGHRFPDVHDRRLQSVFANHAIGTASILHCHHLSHEKSQEYARWVEEHIVNEIPVDRLNINE